MYCIKKFILVSYVFHRGRPSRQSVTPAAAARGQQDPRMDSRWASRCYQSCSNSEFDSEVGKDAIVREISEYLGGTENPLILPPARPLGWWWESWTILRRYDTGPSKHSVVPGRGGERETYETMSDAYILFFSF